MKRVFALMLTAALLLGASAAAEKRKVEPLLLPMPFYNQHDYVYNANMCVAICSD